MTCFALSCDIAAPLGDVVLDLEWTELRDSGDSLEFTL